MPFTAWRTLSRYLDKLGEGQLYEAAATMLQEDGTIEALQAFLADLAKEEQPDSNGYLPVWKISDRAVQLLMKEQPDACIVVLVGEGWEGREVKVKVKK